MKIRAKMQVMEVTTNSYGQEAVKLQAVCGSTPEDSNFAKATPCATLTMTIDNPDAQGILKAGSKFYVDFTKVKEQAPAPAATT